MYIFKKTHFSLVVFLVSFFQVSKGQNNDLDKTITGLMQEYHIPGLAASIINNGEVSWTGYYGYQDLENKIPVTSKSIFMIASVSKTITAAALLKLHEEGKFKMDDNINSYLPFEVKHPRYPNVPITFAQLLRHRSSISDNTDYLDKFWDFNNGDPKIPLGEFLKDYLSIEGKNYYADKNYQHEKPGTTYQYSNIGIALAGYLVEIISRTPFDEYCRYAIFKPLRMENSAWFLKDANVRNVAIPYRYVDTINNFMALNAGGYPDYPAGQLRSTVEDLSNFLISWVQQGKFYNHQIFKPTSIDWLTPRDISLGYYVWSLFGTERGTLLYSHGGSDNGISSYILYNPKTKKGMVFLSNGELKKGFQFKALINAIYNSTPGN